MAYMSYCRFEGTYKEMIECYHALPDCNEDTSDNEKHYAKRLYELAKDYVSLYEDLEFDSEDK